MLFLVHSNCGIRRSERANIFNKCTLKKVAKKN